MSEWQKGIWKDIGRLEYGRALRGYENGAGRFPVYGTNGPIGFTDKPLSSSSTVVIGRKGAYRGVHYSQLPCHVIDTAFYLEVDPKKIDMKWAYYKLLTYDINSMDSGSAIPSTSRDAFYQLPLEIPPLSIQRQIAAILSAFDDKIELNRQMNRTLEQMARALFKSWFVDFDPVRAKMRGEEPEGMDAETAALFPNALGEIEGREVPEGWGMGSIAEIAHINRRVLKKDDLLQKIDYIEISAVSKGEISEVIEYTRGTEPSRARRRLRHGDTVLSTVRPDRHAYFLTLNPPETLIASTGFAVLTPKQDIFWPFVFVAATQGEVFTQLGQAADGGAYPAINAAIIGELEVCMPDQNRIFQSFFEIIAPLLFQSDQIRRESTQLAQLRDALLPRLLSGEVNVGAFEGTQ